jgi:hypothetical protein
MMPLDLSVLTDLESNEEKYSLSVTGKKTEDSDYSRD